MNRLPFFFIRFLQLQNRFQRALGQTFAWLALTLVLTSALVVLLRYGFDTGSIALQESLIYQHAILFMMGMAYTLQAGKHVRVDIFYTNQPPHKQAWIDLIGAIFLALPSLIFILWASWDYVAASWQILETSSEAGGLPFIYLLKSFILIMAFLLGLQVIAMATEAYLKIAHRNLEAFKTYLVELAASAEERL